MSETSRRTVSPENVVSLIQRLHVMDRSERAKHEPPKVQPSVVDLETEDWHVIFENGFADAILEVLLSGHLCGFSQSELTSFTNEGYLQQYKREIEVSFILWTSYSN